MDLGSGVVAVGYKPL